MTHSRKCSIPKHAHSSWPRDLNPSPALRAGWKSSGVNPLPCTALHAKSRITPSLPKHVSIWNFDSGDSAAFCQAKITVTIRWFWLQSVLCTSHGLLVFAVRLRGKQVESNAFRLSSSTCYNQHGMDVCIHLSVVKALQTSSVCITTDT